MELPQQEQPDNNAEKIKALETEKKELEIELQNLISGSGKEGKNIVNLSKKEKIEAKQRKKEMKRRIMEIDNRINVLTYEKPAQEKKPEINVIEAAKHRVEELKQKGREETEKIKAEGGTEEDILKARTGEKKLETEAKEIERKFEIDLSIPEIVPLENLNEQEFNEKLKEVDKYILQEGIDLAHFNDGDYSDEQIKIINYREEILRKKSSLDVSQKRNNEKQPPSETGDKKSEEIENIFNSVYNEYKDKNFGLEGYEGLWRVKNASKGRFELENLGDKTIKTIGTEDLYASIKKYDLDFLQKQKENIQNFRGMTEKEREDKLSGIDEKITNLEKEISESEAKDVNPEEKTKKKYEMREILLKLRDVLDSYKKRGDLISKLSGKRDKGIQSDIDQCNENIEKYYNDLIKIEDLENMIGSREFNMLLEIEDRVIKKGIAKDRKVEKEGDATIINELDQKLKKRSALIQQVLNLKKRGDIDENEIASGQTAIGAFNDEIFNLHRKISEMKLEDLSDDERKILIKSDRLVKSGKLNYGKITEMPKSDIFGLGNNLKKVSEILKTAPGTSADTKPELPENIEQKIEFLKKQYEIANLSKDPESKLNANHIKMELKNFGVEVKPETTEEKIEFLRKQYEIANLSKDPKSVSKAHELNKEIESLKAQIMTESKPASELEEIIDLKGFDMPSFAAQNEEIPKTAEDIRKNLIKLFEAHQNKDINAVNLVSNAIEFCQLNKLDDEGLVLTEIQSLFEMDKIDQTKLDKARAENEKLSSPEIKLLFSSLIDKSEESAKSKPIKKEEEQKEEEKTTKKFHELNIGDTVVVERSDGTVDSVGWFIHSINPDGKITVIKPDEKDYSKDMFKTLDSEDLASWQEKYKADKWDESQEIPDYKDDKEIGDMSIDQLSEEKDKVGAYLNVLLKDGRAQSEEFEKYNTYLSSLMNALEKISKKPKIEVVPRQTRESLEAISMAEAIKMARERSEQIDEYMEASGFNGVLAEDAERILDIEMNEEVRAAKEKVANREKLTTADFRALQRRLENVAITTTTSAVADTAKMTLLHAYGKYPTQMEMLKERAAYLHDINESLRVTIQSLDAAEIYREKEKDERSLLGKIGHAFGRGGKKEKKSESVEGAEANCKLSEGDMDRLNEAKNIEEIKLIIEKIGSDIETIKSNDDVKDATKDTLSQTFEAMKTLSSVNKKERKKKLKALKGNIDKITSEDFDNNLKNYFKSLFDKIDEFSPDNSEQERGNGGNEPQAESQEGQEKKSWFGRQWEKVRGKKSTEGEKLTPEQKEAEKINKKIDIEERRIEWFEKENGKIVEELEKKEEKLEKAKQSNNKKKADKISAEIEKFKAEKVAAAVKNNEEIEKSKKELTRLKELNENSAGAEQEKPANAENVENSETIKEANRLIEASENADRLGTAFDYMSYNGIIKDKEEYRKEFKEMAADKINDGSDNALSDAIAYSRKEIAGISASKKISQENKDILVKFYGKVIEVAEGKKGGGGDGKSNRPEIEVPQGKFASGEAGKEEKVDEEKTKPIEIDEQMKEGIKKGLEKIKKDNEEAFWEIGYLANGFSKDERLFGDIFTKSRFDNYMKDMGIKYEKIKDIKTKDFMAVIKAVYEEVKGDGKDNKKPPEPKGGAGGAENGNEGKNKLIRHKGEGASIDLVSGRFPYEVLDSEIDKELRNLKEAAVGIVDGYNLYVFESLKNAISLKDIRVDVLKARKLDVYDNKIIDSLNDGNKDLSIKFIREATIGIKSLVEELMFEARSRLRKNEYIKVDRSEYEKHSEEIKCAFVDPFTKEGEYYVKKKKARIKKLQTKNRLNRKARRRAGRKEVKGKSQKVGMRKQ